MPDNFALGFGVVAVACAAIGLYLWFEWLFERRQQESEFWQSDWWRHGVTPSLVYLPDDHRPYDQDARVDND